jgi:hypothetical protein
MAVAQHRHGDTLMDGAGCRWSDELRRAQRVLRDPLEREERRWRELSPTSHGERNRGVWRLAVDDGKRLARCDTNKWYGALLIEAHTRGWQNGCSGGDRARVRTLWQAHVRGHAADEADADRVAAT